MEIYEITTQQERRRVAPLFAGLEDSLIDTFVQGYGGYGWCDDLAFPRSAMIVSRSFDFVFYGGDPASENAKDLASVVPEGCKGEVLLVPCDDGWLPLLEETRQGKCRRTTRYRMKRDKAGFNKELLRQYTRDLPDGYVLLGMDEEMYDLAKAQEWSRDLCVGFETAEDFVEKGIGFCVLHGEEFVAGAASMDIFDDGIEIQIDTHKDHQRKGLALACGAALVLNCLAQNKYPCWDAAFEGSLHLAEKLGYQLKAPYTALFVNE